MKAPCCISAIPSTPIDEAAPGVSFCHAIQERRQKS